MGRVFLIAMLGWALCAGSVAHADPDDDPSLDDFILDQLPPRGLVVIAIDPEADAAATLNLLAIGVPWSECMLLPGREDLPVLLGISPPSSPWALLHEDELWNAWQAAFRGPRQLDIPVHELAAGRTSPDALPSEAQTQSARGHVLDEAIAFAQQGTCARPALVLHGAPGADRAAIRQIATQRAAEAGIPVAFVSVEAMSDDTPVWSLEGHGLGGAILYAPPQPRVRSTHTCATWPEPAPPILRPSQGSLVDDRSLDAFVRTSLPEGGVVVLGVHNPRSRFATRLLRYVAAETPSIDCVALPWPESLVAPSREYLLGAPWTETFGLMFADLSDSLADKLTLVDPDVECEATDDMLRRLHRDVRRHRPLVLAGKTLHAAHPAFLFDPQRWDGLPDARHERRLDHAVETTQADQHFTDLLATGSCTRILTMVDENNPRSDRLGEPNQSRRLIALGIDVTTITAAPTPPDTTVPVTLQVVTDARAHLELDPASVERTRASEPDEDDNDDTPDDP